jgi:hypothetical protein
MEGANDRVPNTAIEKRCSKFAVRVVTMRRFSLDEQNSGGKLNAADVTSHATELPRGPLACTGLLEKEPLSAFLCFPFFLSFFFPERWCVSLRHAAGTWPLES